MIIKKIIPENGIITETIYLTPNEIKLMNECKCIAIRRYKESGISMTKQTLELLHYSMLGILRFEGEQRLREYVCNARLNKKSSTLCGYC